VNLRWSLWSLLSPSQVLLGAVILGAVLLALGRIRPGRLLCVAGGTGIVLFGLLPLSHYLAVPLEARFAQPELPSQIAGVVLLAGAERPAATEAHGEPQLNFRASRYTATLRLAERYPAARVVFTGGPAVDPGTGRLEQTGVAKELFATTGVDPARVSFEERSGDTCESAANTRALVQPRAGETWVVVTSAMHVPRAVACFRAVGWDVVAQPADYQVVPGGLNLGSFRIADNLALLDAALHEWLGLLYYRLTGRTDELFPSQFEGGP
jgi:uncharacterized SAM-binding protein YcdF (DUF218 family)